MNLAEYIRTERTKRGLTQRQLAREVRLSHVYISSIECGRKKAGAKVMRGIARYFKIDIREVVKMNE